VAALIALSFRRALPGVVIVLALVGFGLTVDGAHRLVWLPLAFILFAGAVLMFSRSLERQRWRLGDTLAGGAVALFASLLALSLLATTPLAASQPWGNWRAWGPYGSGISNLTFDWMTNFARLLDPQTNAPVLRVASPVAAYWRANALDAFDGTSWVNSVRSWSFDARLPAGVSTGNYTYTVPESAPPPPGKTVTEIFQIQAAYTDFFFTGGIPRSITVSRPMPIFVNPMMALGVSVQLGPSLRYVVTAVIPQLKPRDLVGRGRHYPPALTPYLGLPFPRAAQITGEAKWRTVMAANGNSREWLGLYRLNRTIVQGATDPYEIALRIEQYLRANYAYSLAPPPTRYRSPYAAFLFKTKAGYCQHFAGAMAALLRFNGIPARVAVGFVTGRKTGADTYQVSRNDAHAWVEAYFPQVGWVPFDPTPGSSLPGTGPSSSTAGFVNPYGSAGASGASHVQSPSGPPQPSQRLAETSQTGGKRSAGSTPIWLAWLVLPLAAAAGWPAGRAALRRRRLRRGSVEQRLRASVSLVLAELRERGVAVPQSQTLQETARVIREYLGLEAASLTDRVEAVLFGSREATEQDLVELADLRRHVRRRLRARKGWLVALAAHYRLSRAVPQPRAS
jgi:transglutaminase-like putative cysteine protease